MAADVKIQATASSDISEGRDPYENEPRRGREHFKRKQAF